MSFRHSVTNRAAEKAALIIYIFGRMVLRLPKKNERELKVCAMSGYNYKSVPAIRLMGQWLEAAGFHIGDPVLVKCEDGKLIISLDIARAELMEDEKEALGENMGVTRRVVQKYINVLKESGRIERVGGKRYGYWKIND